MAACEVIAHRGWSEKYPENTLRAFDAALKLGVTGCECDVHLSQDQVPYLMHDHSFTRTTGDTSASNALTMADIARLDAGRWKDPVFAGEPVPSLIEALQLHRGRGHLVIEIKDQGPAQQVALQVAHSIQTAGAQENVSLIAFDFGHLVAASAVVPEARACWLLSEVPRESAELDALLTGAWEQGLTGLSVHHTSITADLAERIHGAGKQLWVWTVNEDRDLDRVLKIGVDSITSDRPDWLLERLR